MTREPQPCQVSIAKKKRGEGVPPRPPSGNPHYPSPLCRSQIFYYPKIPIAAKGEPYANRQKNGL